MLSRRSHCGPTSLGCGYVLLPGHQDPSRLFQTDCEKVVQEAKLARHVSVVCGESKFTLDAFSILAWDLCENPDYLTIRGSVAHSKHLNGWLTKRNMGSATIWELVADHVDYHCADARDRVFALLSLSTGNSIHPDYTKSTFQVLLELLEEDSFSVYDPLFDSSSGPGMENVWNIIGGFHIGPLAAEIADMLRSRRSVHAVPSHLSQGLVFGRRDQRHIVLHANLCCTIWEDAAGNMVTSLLKNSPPSTHVHGHDLRYIEQYTEDDDAVKIRNPLGRVVALANKKVKAGDILLFSRDLGGPHFSGLVPLAAGLIVRPLECGVHIVVGQVVVDHGIRPPEMRVSRDVETDPVGFEIGNNDWWVYMSPIDLLLFVAQGTKFEVSSPSEGTGPVIKQTFCPEKTAKRLTTGVTTDLISSFVLRKRDWGSLQTRLPIVLHPGSIGFP
jgi:hypothetical protein